ncbi:hypothetical protein BUZ40_12430, partial [Staphylococcus haemolyticus]
PAGATAHIALPASASQVVDDVQLRRHRGGLGGLFRQAPAAAGAALRHHHRLPRAAPGVVSHADHQLAGADVGTLSEVAERPALHASTGSCRVGTFFGFTGSKC